jgi:wyosine [tRNA(Phe)-imidazoG37] synthetase (radical SAM superfamily)
MPTSKVTMSILQIQTDITKPVFGPISSRRFGKSLGVNPLPPGGRLCNFDCIYCECATASWPLEWDLRPQFPTPQQIYDGLVCAAETFGPDEMDSIMIGGNGEPALTPYLDEVVDIVSEARDRDWPEARTVILTNGTMCHKSNVRAALAKLDQRVVKFDAGTNWMLDELNRPAAKFCVNESVRRISMMPDIVIQAMFVHGPIDNTSRNEIEAWVNQLARIAPESVQIYSLAQTPAKSWVRQVRRGELEAIAAYVEDTAGIHTQVF